MGTVRALVRTVLVAVVAANAAVVGVLPGRAVAGTYSVSGCRTTWVPDVQNTTGLYAVGTSDQCVDPNPYVRWLAASLGGAARINAGDYAGWRFDAPPDTAIVATSVTWEGRGDYAAVGHGADIVTLASSASGQSVEHFDPFSTTDTLSTPDARWVRAYILCKAESGSTCRGAGYDSESPETPRLTIWHTSVTLLDRYAPDVSRVGGSALTDDLWTGLEPLSFDAADRGGGLFRVGIDVDGKLAGTVPVVSDDRCTGGASGSDFAYPVPCPAQVSKTVWIDAAQLPAGSHVVAVDVEDAAANRAIVIPPTRKVIVNDYRVVGYYANGQFFNPRLASPRVLNGDGAIGDAKLSAAFVRHVGKGRSRHRVQRARREVRYSQRATVSGTLTAPSGAPISHATVFVGQRPEGQQWRLDGTVRTNSRGTFVYRPAARQPSRGLRAVYFPFSDSHENVTSGVLRLGVHAGMTLRVNRHRLRNGDRLVFTGRVLGPVPAAGIAVTLQAKVGSNYRSFRQLRATGRNAGRIRTVYRFERTTRPARYHFRLKVVRQAGLPFESGVSPTVSVLVRP